MIYFKDYWNRNKIKIVGSNRARTKHPTKPDIHSRYLYECPDDYLKLSIGKAAVAEAGRTRPADNRIYTRVYRGFKSHLSEIPTGSANNTTKKIKKTNGFLSCKGEGQIDYVIAIGIFIVVFGVTINYLTNYFRTVEDPIRITTLRSQALSLMNIADFGFFPDNWTNETYPDRIGLQSDAYRFYILVNNTQSNLVNQSQSVVDLTNELVSFNYTYLGFSVVDYNSTAIYNETGSIVDYGRSGDTISFAVNISANSQKWFTVYFDDDSNFTDRTKTISGSNNLTEKIFSTEKISLIQYKKIQRLQAANYAKIKNSTGTFFDFYLNITDVSRGVSIFAFGENIPNETNVISLQRYVIYQNSTADIVKGRMLTKVW